MDNNMTIDIHIDASKKAYAHYVIEQNGIKEAGDILFSQLVKQLDKSKTLDGELIRVSTMPDGFVGGALHPNGSVTGVVAIFIPAAIQRMAWENGKDSIMVPYPNIILVHYLTDGRLLKTKAFAVKEKNIVNITDETKLYTYPYGNVSPTGGRVCWGSNRFDVITSFRDLNILTNMFITSPTNSDLYNPKLSTKKNINLVDLVKLQSLRKEFDNSILKENGYSFKDIFEDED